MGRITEIKRIKSVAVLLVDGCEKLRIRYSDFEKTGLSSGDFFDDESFLDFLAAKQFSDAYEYALTVLDSSDKTRSAMRKKLIFAGFVPPCADAVTEKLAESGLIDDTRIASRVVESAKHAGNGYYAVKRKLMAKGISSEDAEEALSEISPEEQLTAAKQAARKYFVKYECEDKRKTRMKVSQALARRGFSWSIISEAMEDLGSDDWE